MLVVLTLSWSGSFEDPVGAPKLKLDLANAAKDDGTVAMLGISKVEDVGAVLGGSLERLTSSGACAGVLGIGLGAVTIPS
jgi:hypothetical protein